MPRNARGVMARAMSAGQRGKGGRAGGKEGKRGLGDRAREAIHEAASMASTDPAGAAERFLEFAGVADERGMAQVATFLALRACDTHTAAGDGAAAVAAGRVAVGFAEGMAEKKRVGRFFVRSLKRLEAVDKDGSSELAEFARKQLGLKKLPTPGERLSPNRAQRRSLPKSCSSCGLQVDGAAIEFEDDGTVDCPQCGADLG